MRVFLGMVVLLFASSAVASEQWSAGVDMGVLYFGAFTVAASITAPLAESADNEQVLLARLGVTTGFSGAPAVAATLLIRDASGDFEPYVGVGLGLSFTPTVFTSAHGLVGVRSPAWGPAFFRSEFMLSVAAGLAVPSLRVGIELPFGGAR